MKKLIILTFIILSSSSYSQNEDAWVFFTDKENVQQSIDNPISILTQEAIDRKNSHSVLIDERDVPVNEAYITHIKNATGIIVLAKSKWFNCVYVRGTETNIRGLITLPFVDRLDFADNSLDIAGKRITVGLQKKTSSKNKFETLADFNYGNAEQQIKQLNGEYLHQQNYTGTGMIIAVIDDGFPGVNTQSAFARARNDGRILDGYDFVDRNDDEFAFSGDDHGTQTFSDIAGYIDGQFVGTAPDAKYYLFRTEDINSEGPHEEAFWLEAVERADSLGVDVINTSLGYALNFDNPAYAYQTSDMDGQTAFSSKGATIAFEKGMLLVNSAGNDGNKSWRIVAPPADSPGVLTVGSVTNTGTYSSFSSQGPTADNRIKPDVMARGSSAAVINASGSITTNSGTSFSSPIMTGLVACLWQAFPSMTNGEIMQLIRESASLYNNPTNQMGYGIPNFKSIMESLSISSNKIEGLDVYPNPVRNRLFFEFNTPKPLSVSIYTIDGKMVKSKNLNTTGEISLESLSTGLYIVEIASNTAKNTIKISKL